MARETIYDLSQTDSENTNAQTGLQAADSMNPATLDDTMRGTMAWIAELLADLTGTTTPGTANDAGGSANALTLTANASFTSLAQGRIVALKATAANTGAATLNVNSTGAKKIRYMTASGDADIAAGMIADNGVYLFVFNTDADSGSGGWVIVNPGISTSLYAADGTAGAPSISFTDDTDTGLYRPGANQLSVAAGGSNVATLTGSAITVQVPFRSQAGASSAVSYGPSGDGNTGMYFPSSDQVALAAGGNTGVTVTSTAVLVDHDLRVGNAANISVGSGSAVGLTVDESTGQLVVSSDSSTVPVRIREQSNTGDAGLVTFNTLTSTVGSIALNGATTGTVYNTTSDARLKENARPFDAGAIIDALEPVEYEWRVNGETEHGLLAQDAYQVLPEAVHVGSDAGPDDPNFDPWQIDYSKYVPLLLAEVKALRARVAELEAR